MTLSHVVTGQDDAIDTLAAMLRLRRERVATLLRRREHPLPLPPHQPMDDAYIFNSGYMLRLEKWLNDESYDHIRQRYYVLGRSEILSQPPIGQGAVKVERRWGIDEKLDRFPQGYFLG